jgi:hypothetical protein
MGHPTPIQVTFYHKMIYFFTNPRLWIYHALNPHPLLMADSLITSIIDQFAAAGTTAIRTTHQPMLSFTEHTVYQQILPLSFINGVTAVWQQPYRRLKLSEVVHNNQSNWKKICHIQLLK